MENKLMEDRIFVNGKKQVIELLQKMNNHDKKILLKNLRQRNPVLAEELFESCISFESIWDLSDQQLERVMRELRPAIIGLALSLVNVKKQKRALSLIDRQRATKAFSIMTKDLSQNRRECIRAQEKILELTKILLRNKIISFH